jgi:hypothetical protein
MPWKELGYAVGLLVLLAALYVGAYYGMVKRQPRALAPDRDEDGFLTVSPKYPIAQEPFAVFFRPMHVFDRRVRKGFWRAQFSDFFEEGPLLLAR